jgi:1,4-dihydroxy-6-naphthoate synthase
LRVIIAGMKMLSIGYSPCPNDTFIFHALVQGLVREEGLGFKERLEDVEALNSLALAGGLDITKVSFGVVTEVLERYCLLRSGGALGRGCGPLVVAREPLDMSVLRGKRIAVPGKHTTAYLLLKLFDPALSENAVPMAFDLIMDAVRAGEVHAGLIIHEGRFTYPSYGLKEVLDLGRWWEGGGRRRRESQDLSGG